MKNFTKIKRSHFGNNHLTMVKIFILFGLLSAFSCQQCFANPIAMDFESLIIGTEYHPGVLRHIYHVMAVDILVDLAVLVVGFIMIRRVQHLTTLKFIIYLIIVVIGGLAIDELSLYVERTSMLHSLVGFFLTFFLLFVFNFFLCSALFRFPSRKAAFIAVLMGLLTHPTVYAELSAMFIFGMLLLLLIGSYVQRACSPEIDSSCPKEDKFKTPLVQVKANKTERRCPAVEIGTIVLELSRLAVQPESEQTTNQIIQLGRKLDGLPKISSDCNLVYAFRTILEFLREKDALKIAHIWEGNGWNVRKWMSEDLYSL